MGTALRTPRTPMRMAMAFRTARTASNMGAERAAVAAERVMAEVVPVAILMAMVRRTPATPTWMAMESRTLRIQTRTVTVSRMRRTAIGSATAPILLEKEIRKAVAAARKVRPEAKAA